MKLKIWSLIFLVLFAFTLATCLPSLDQPSSSGETSPTQNSEQSDAADSGSVSTERPTDCRVSLFDESAGNNSALTCAGVYGFQEKKLLINNDEPKATIALLFHRDKLQTKDSEAELIFNTLDMAKANVNTSFEFEEGLRTSELEKLEVELKQGKLSLTIGDILISAGRADPQSNESNQADVNNDSTSRSQSVGRSQSRNAISEASLLGVSTGEAALGTGLYVVERNDRNFISQSGRSNPSRDDDSEALPLLGVRTDEMDIASSAGVYVVKRDERQKRTQIFNLSKEEIRVADKSKTVRVIGESQTVAASENGFLDGPFEFPLCSFYVENQEFIEGLKPDDEEFVNGKQKTLQVAYDIARSMTVPIYWERCQRRCPIPSVY